MQEQIKEYIKEYFSRAMDFAGGEQGDTYRRYCLIHAVGLFVMNFAIPILFTALSFILRSDGIKQLLMLLIMLVSVIWVEPIVAATYRRTWTVGKSKVWLFPYCSLLAWLLLGKDEEVSE